MLMGVDGRQRLSTCYQTSSLPRFRKSRHSANGLAVMPMLPDMVQFLSKMLFVKYMLGYGKNGL